MRILLLTDSLGCPRDEILVERTWTDRIIRKWGDRATIYTLCRHGLTTASIDKNWINEIKPDYIVTQVGIVDACRRALGRKGLYVFQRIPIVGKLVNSFCSKHHYSITKHRNVHYASSKQFYDFFNDISKIEKVKIMYIDIAPPGNTMKKKVYNVENDIELYNKKVRSIKNLYSINPYEIVERIDDILLQDGHHLNETGQDMVFDSVDRELVSMIGGTNDE